MSENSMETNGFYSFLAMCWDHFGYIWGALLAVLGDPTIDTVFLLSSGEPEVGLYVHHNRVVDHLVDWNRFRKMVVHGVAYSKSKWNQDQIRHISEGTGGSFMIVD